MPPRLGATEAIDDRASEQPTENGSGGVEAEAADVPDARPPSAVTRDSDAAAGQSRGGSRTFVGPLESAVRHPFLTILPLVLLLGVAAAVGLIRDPVYTADASVNVGTADVPAFTLQGVIIGNSALAAGYARVLSAEPVITAAARDVGIDPDDARSRLSASPVPGATIIRVEGEGPSADAAIALANAGGTALIRYIEDVTTDDQALELLKAFRQARGRTFRARRILDRLEREDASAAAIRRARLDVETAALRAERLANEFRGGQREPAEAQLLQLIGPAAEADSDFWSVLQRLLLVGAAAGLVLGFALALLRENRALLRRSPA